MAFSAGADMVSVFWSPRKLARVKAALRRTRREEDPRLRAYEFGDVKLDFERYRATRGGKALALSAREFALLGYFIRHRGKVVSRDDLLTSVWGHEEPPETVVGGDRRENHDERCGGTGDLRAGTTEERRDEPGNDGGVQAVLRRGPHGDSQRHRQRKGHDPHHEARQEVLAELRG
jgi:hypothetical protein